MPSEPTPTAKTETRGQPGDGASANEPQAGCFWLPPPQVARRFGIKVDKVRSWIRAGEFGERKRQTLIPLTNVLLKIRESGVFASHAVRDRLAFWVNIGDAMPGEIEWMFQPAIPHLEANDVHELRRLFEFT